MAPPDAVVREHVTPFVRAHLPGIDSSAPALVESCMCVHADAYAPNLSHVVSGFDATH
jgi:hypothetical protein